MHFIIVPEGDESEVENFHMSDNEDEVNQLTVLPLPENIEVFDYTSEVDESGTELGKEENKERPSSSKKDIQSSVLTRSKKKRSSRKTGQSVPKWSKNEHVSVTPPNCDSTYPAPPRKPMTPYQYFSLFMDTNITTDITSETNKYAEQETGEDAFITCDEFEHYLGTLLLTDIVKMPSSVCTGLVKQDT